MREDIEPIFTKDFVSVKIDLEKMAGAKELIESYAKKNAGVPFLVILSPDGTALVNSFAPNGQNIGSPIAEWEIEHWNTMMRKTAKRITPEEILYMAKTLAEDRKED